MLTLNSVLVFDMIPIKLPKPALNMNHPNVLGKMKISNPTANVHIILIKEASI
jgi:hypothetical protein